MFLVAGEASGDLHGATLARALLALSPGLALSGMGGPRMAAAGVGLVRGIDRVAVVGGTEVLGRRTGDSPDLVRRPLPDRGPFRKEMS